MKYTINVVTLVLLLLAAPAHSRDSDGTSGGSGDAWQGTGNGCCKAAAIATVGRSELGTNLNKAEKERTTAAERLNQAAAKVESVLRNGNYHREAKARSNYNAASQQLRDAVAREAAATRAYNDAVTAAVRGNDSGNYGGNTQNFSTGGGSAGNGSSARDTVRGYSPMSPAERSGSGFGAW